MARININGITSYVSSTPMVDNVTFNYLGRKVYSATQIDRIYATFVSNVVEASSSFLRWSEIVWSESKDRDFDVQLFVKTATSALGLQTATWDGPHINGNVDLEEVSGQYLQFCVLLRKETGSTSLFPNVKDISLKYYTSDTASKFYTRTFNVGFTPKSVVLTYNADTVEDAIIRFGISGVDSADTSYYQYIEPNKIVKLDSISYLSEDIKIMLEMIGTSESQVVVHEFALMFSGEDAFRVNKVYMESSSSEGYSTSSSSSSLSTSSSSSIDSSSSSSSSSESSSSSSSSPQSD